MRLPDLTSIISFFVGLGLVVSVCLGATFFAAWLRTKFIWSPFGRFLYNFGLRRANGMIEDLRKGKRYVVSQNFIDRHGNSFQTGETLTFVKHEYFPYHGGYVLEFEERAIYLQEIENAEILQKIWAYLETIRK
jgi:hypothetical protein